jgi:predicted phosphoadenosine phosphosulfate sulfurtransferase
MNPYPKQIKIPLGVDVLEAARERVRFAFDSFDEVFVALSGGKDSGVVFNLALEEARSRGRVLHTMCVDLEAQYAHTADFVERCFSHPDVVGHWICLPMNLRNSVSQFAPFWLCWDPHKEEQWVRELPDHPLVVKDESFFSFFRRGMEFEEFVVEYGEWMREQVGGTVGALIGIRTDESLNRWRTLFSETKTAFRGKSWTTVVFKDAAARAGYRQNGRGKGAQDAAVNVYPIFDWRPSDIWAATGKCGWDYNRVYDLMWLAGLTLHQMRLCQPYGDDQRKGLWLYKVLEPETWKRVVARVEGANFGSRHAGARILGNFRIDLPEGHTWESYAKFLLVTMPPNLSAHYTGKINTYFRWWAWHCKGRDLRSTVVGEDDQYDEMGIYRNEAIPYEGFTGEGPDIPSWRDPLWKRICRVLIKNDYWCKGIGFQQTKGERERMQQVLMEVVRAGE